MSRPLDSAAATGTWTAGVAPGPAPGESPAQASAPISASAPGVAPQEAAQGRVTDHPAPAPNARGTLLATLVATFVALMVYTAPLLTVPTLSGTFHTSLSAQAWLLNGTPLGLAAVLLVAGGLADDFGRRRLFLIGTVGLAVTTALSALTDDTLLFTLTRVAQGAASAAILAASLGLIAHAFPAGPSRLRATGAWGAAVSGGIALGPLLAAALNGLGWRALYLVLGAAALGAGVYAARVLSESRAAHRARPDLPGAAALGLAFTALLTALTLGRNGWLAAPVLLLLAAMVVLLAVFALIERRSAAPLVDLGLLKHTPFQSSVLGALFTGIAVIGFFSYLPVVVEGVLHLSVFQTAWIVVLWAGTAAVVAYQAKRLHARFAVRHQMAAGFVLHAAGILTMLGAVGASSEARLLPGVFVAGLGSGLLNAALPRLSVESVPPQRAAMGSGANNTARYIGSSVGVALMLALVTSAGTTARGADTAIVVMAAVTLLGALLVLVLRGRRGDGPAGS
ncbi:MFS transporter [Streptomyces montanisoli]|uniref:MFS transporter n=1 Tax=Streptomyces montanisoli TaxID=2798581 RepID=A0A940MDR9_9ACTN|nr:MFS transporter [Streptomyces montanisoli]MBP0461100.1 MFS transporter [Streptomyces montanisoli]